MGGEEEGRGSPPHIQPTFQSRPSVLSAVSYVHNPAFGTASIIDLSDALMKMFGARDDNIGDGKRRG